MNLDLIVAEIGSTTTVVNAFSGSGENISFTGQGQYPTTVLEGDVNIGLKGAIEDLEKNLGEKVNYKHLLASSSAAGGLRMTVHGLVYDMTVKAAKEAALGAGANIKYITAGNLRRTDLKKIEEIKPNIILIAGGVDFGERETALHNAELIRSMNLKIPVIYAGNIENQEEIKLIFEGYEGEVFIVDNVYPRIDELNIEPTRKVIQKVFEENIIHAKGMEKIRSMVDGNIIPTPGAVMEASILLREDLGNLVCVDIGGATTDVHSVCEDSEEYSRILLDPEPMSKRTVEGDLGLYVNKEHVADLFSDKELNHDLKMEWEDFNRLVKSLPPIPKTEEEFSLVTRLSKKALTTALKRHGGKIKPYFGPSGRKFMAEGKDLTSVKSFVGTGGALTRLPEAKKIIREALLEKGEMELLPRDNVEIFIDRDYIMASLGVLSLKFPEEAKTLLRKSLGIQKDNKKESK